MLFDKFLYKKTNFESGGLLPSIKSPKGVGTVRTPKVFVAPRKIDSRDMCLSSSNQYQTPHCAGYSTAGYIEYQNWKTKHYPEQIDGDIIYKRAKEKFDHSPANGTTLEAAALSAIDLGLIKGKPKRINYTNIDKDNKKEASIKFGLHEYGVIVAGFMITDEWDWVNKKTGMIRDLGNQSRKKGGHAVLLCGYDNNGVYIQNSWGEEWGHHGFAILSWEQFHKQFMYAVVIK